MIRRPPRSTLDRSSAASDVYKRQQVRFAQTIHASGMDLLGLINDLLDLAKIEAGAVTALSLAPTPLADLAQELERMFRPLAQEKGLQLGIELAPGLPASIRTD